MKSNRDEKNDFGTLAAYRSVKWKMVITLSLLIPVGTITFLIMFCQASGGEYALDATVNIGSAQKIALIIHGLYFIMLTFSFELMVDSLPFPGSSKKLRFGEIPKRPDNLYWMMTCLSAELFFVGGVAFLLLATQTAVPRWILIIPLAQCAYNMKNDLLWVGFGKTFSPIRKRVSIMLLDWVIISVFFLIYIHHFFTAN